MHRLASRRATSPAPRERKRQSAFLRWSTHACRQLLDRGREQAIRGRSILQNNENGSATASQHTRIAARRRYFSNQKINTRNRRFGWYRPSRETVSTKIDRLRATFFATPTAASSRLMQLALEVPLGNINGNARSRKPRREITALVKSPEFPEFSKMYANVRFASRPICELYPSFSAARKPEDPS